jgi:hypothetical protein
LQREAGVPSVPATTGMPALIHPARELDALLVGLFVAGRGGVVGDLHLARAAAARHVGGMWSATAAKACDICPSRWRRKSKVASVGSMATFLRLQQRDEVLNRLRVEVEVPAFSPTR